MDPMVRTTIAWAAIQLLACHAEALTQYSTSATAFEYCSFGICFPTAGTFTLNMADVPRSPIGNGTLEIEWYGESDDNIGEWLDLSLEGYSFGRLSNGNPNDDLFGGVGSGGPDRWNMNYAGGVDALIQV